MNYTGYKKGIYLKPHAIKKRQSLAFRNFFFTFATKKDINF